MRALGRPRSIASEMSDIREMMADVISASHGDDGMYCPMAT